jgi:hypothetical protein
MSTAGETVSEIHTSAPEASPTSAPEATASDEPDPLQTMKTLALAGDLAGLLDAFIRFPEVVAEIRKIRVLLRMAVKRASKRSPRRFMREVYREATAFLAYVQMRLHIYAVVALSEADRQPQARLEALPDELTGKVLPQIEHLMRLTMALNQSWAQTDRLWQLARRSNATKRGRPGDFNSWYDEQVEAGILPDLNPA